MPRFMRWRSLLAAAAVLAAATFSAGPSTSAAAVIGVTQSQVDSPAGLSSNSLADAGKARYVFLFIGDGMASAQRTAAELYLASTSGAGQRPELTKLNMNKLPAQGMNTTYDLTSVVPDSASTGTAISTGFKTASGVVGMDPTGTEKYPTIAEAAKARGMKVGIVSAVSLDHATPAAFYAHQPSRSKYYDIAIELGKSKFDYFAGGGFLQPKGAKGDQPDAVEAAKANGYTVVTDHAAFDALTPGSGSKVLAMNSVLDSEKALPYELDRASDDISLAGYTRKGIELLDNPNGFFMMVEGGKVDWACHANDAAASIDDTLALDNAVGEALKFYQQHPFETLIVVTGDHETGGMTIGFAGTQYSAFFDKIQNQKLSYDGFNQRLQQYKNEHTADNASFESVLPLIQENFGLTVLAPEERAQLEQRARDKDANAIKQLGMALSDREIDVLKEALAETMKDPKARAKNDYTYLLYGGYEPLTVKLTTILNEKAGIGWTSYSHTGVPVQTSAIGVGADQFSGFYDQPDIHTKLMTITGLQ